MKIKNKRTGRVITVLTVLFFILVGVYIYGSSIPLVRDLPFFEHDHQYRPVLDEKGEVEYWTCAMHPSVKMKDPGSCPICGMDLVPAGKKEDGKRGDGKNGEMNEETGSAGGEHDHSMNGTASSAAREGEGSSEFTVDPVRQQLINVRTEPVIMMDMTKQIRTVGTVELDETKIEHIHTKFSGWIEEVYVDYKWQHVKKGDPLFTVYSPELVSTQEEYLLALRSKRILGESRFKEISEGTDTLVRASRKRLELWDVSESQLREIERTGKVKKSITIHSPITGHVSFKNAFENQHVEPQTLIYTIADHSTAWVNADIYENEIPLVKVGQEAILTVESYPGEKFHGKITFKWPHLMTDTRTTKVRFEFPNPDLKLLPGMYADVSIEIPLGRSLAVPESAVLRTGRQNVVFVNKGNGRMQARRVELGNKAGDYYEVLRGLEVGESVVSRANFLIDAESRLQAATATWGDGEEEDVEMKDLDKDEKGPERDKDQQHIH